jgi:hypothetical protein
MREEGTKFDKRPMTASREFEQPEDAGAEIRS